MKKLKRAIAGILSLLLLLSLASCSLTETPWNEMFAASKDTKDENGPSFTTLTNDTDIRNDDTEKENDVNEKQTYEDDKNTITVMVSSSLSFILDEAVNNVFDEYGISVEFSKCSESDYNKTLMTKLKNGESDIDVYMIFKEDKIDMNNYLANGYFEPLDAYPVADKLDLMFDGVRGLMTCDGKIFGIPISSILPKSVMEVSGAFSEIGCDVPFEISDYKELFGYCDKILDSEKKDITLFRNINDAGMLFTLLAQDCKIQGSVDKEAICSILSDMKKYADANVLFGSNNDGRKWLFSSISSLLLLTSGEKRWSYIEHTMKNLSGEGICIIKSPAGRNYSEICPYISVNPHSEKKDAAMKFLSAVADHIIYDENNDMNLGKNFAENHPELYENKEQRVQKYIDAVEYVFKDSAAYSIKTNISYVGSIESLIKGEFDLEYTVNTMVQNIIGSI